MSKIRVRAVDGVILSSEGPRSPSAMFVGWRRAQPGETIDFAAGDLDLVKLDEVQVDDSAYYRRAIARGDLERIDDEEGGV